MKRIITHSLLAVLLTAAMFDASAHPGHLRITEVNPATGQVEVTNFGPIEFTLVSSLPLCHRLDCASSIPSGTMFAIGETKVFTVTGLDPSDSDLWLYRDTNFSDPGSIISGLKYGPAPNVGHTSTAVAAGLWPNTEAFVAAPAPGNTLQLVAYDPTKPENWASRTPLLASFFGDGTEITDPLPDITKGVVTIELQTVAEGLISPLGMAAPDDGTGRLFIYDQAGKVFILQNGSILPVPFLDVEKNLVNLNANYDERGFLGFALHPDFAANGKVYTYTSEPAVGEADFTTPGGVQNHQSVVAEWTVDPANPNAVDPATRRVILRIDEPQSNHNGGDVHFGPDGMLYIVLGDGGAADDQGGGHSPQGNAQDVNNVYGKILRIDVGGTNSTNGRYGVPPDNPFVATEGVDEIFAYGFRNPYRFSFDRADGTLYVGDVGQNDVEEADIVVKGGNYGWRVKEGNFFFDPNETDPGFTTTLPVVPPPPGLVDPIAAYDHEDGTAVIGGFVYRGKAIASLQGRYVFGDWGRFSTPSGRLFYLDESGAVKELRIGKDDRPLGTWIKGFGQDLDGELYVLGSLNLGPSGATGKVLKIVPPAPPRFEVTAFGVSGLDLSIEFASGQPVGSHRLESRDDLVTGADWAETPALFDDLGNGNFRATFTGLSATQQFYRIATTR